MPRVLIATEGSACSKEAVRRFAALFPIGPSEIALLSVIAPSMRADDHPAAVDYYRREAEAAQEALDLASADLAVAGFSAFGLVRVGEPAETILAVAAELKAELIVLGTHGRHGLEKLLNGSVAETVLHHAGCAVFIYPYPAKSELEGAA